MYRVFIESREYTKYVFRIPDSTSVPVYRFDANGDPNEIVSENISPRIATAFSKISPLQSRMFSGDVFSLENGLSIIHSPVRTKQVLAGVLVLHENRTYGRTLNGRLLYKCIPDDKYLPPFLVPYDVSIGFSKKQASKYITFVFKEWSNSTHPIGTIQDTLGPVDSLDAYYEYQLYCKSLHESLNEMTKATKRVISNTDDSLSKIRNHPHFVFSENTNPFIFTIDPEASSDYDDAFSIENKVNLVTNQTEYTIRVYIANVFVWLETLGLWSSFSRRVSTIYLPDKRRPMLPTILSDTWCSLQEKTPRFAFVVQWRFDEDGNEIGEPKMYQTEIQVSKNFVYESKELLTNPFYKQMFSFCKKIDPKYIRSSHDIVSFWMIKMNRICADYMESHKVGIFRYVSLKEELALDIPGELSENCRRAIHQWNNTTGQYSVYSVDSTKYIHITSPIRRLVDLLNQMIIFKELGVVQEFSKDSLVFLENWINHLDYINTTMRSIRKVQLDCHLLARVMRETCVSDKLHEGVVFDKVCKNDGLIIYMVYLEGLKLISKITLDIDLPNYSIHLFRLFLFQDEHYTKQKIQLQWISNK